MENPLLYVAGQRGIYFTLSKFWKWVLLAIFHGSICFWASYLCLDGPVNNDGEVGGLWFVSSMSFTLIIFVVTYKLFLESTHWTYLGL